ncbi:hypothetical protein FRC01_010459 [Tulasnella sp. 417]|nr:hypothetical protein FRC01_010459 [Tulasnella sp. 417]
MALGNILADSNRLRELVLKEGGLEPALDVLEKPEEYSAKIIEIAASMIEIGTRENNDRRILSRRRKPIVPILLKFILGCPDNTAMPLSHAIKSLRPYVSNAIEMVTNSGIIPRLIELCWCEAENTITLIKSPIIPLLAEVSSDVRVSFDSRQAAAEALATAAKTASSKPDQLLKPLLEARCVEVLTEWLDLTDGRIGCMIL